MLVIPVMKVMDFPVKDFPVAPKLISVAMRHHVWQTQIASMQQIWQFASVRLDSKVI